MWAQPHSTMHTHTIYMLTDIHSHIHSIKFCKDRNMISQKKKMCVCGGGGGNKEEKLKTMQRRTNQLTIQE